MNIAKTTAQNVRKIREEKQLTLDEAANLSGVSRSMLSQIERGEANPTITILWKIANGFKVSFTSLLESNLEEASVQPAQAVCPVFEDSGRYINYPVFPFDEKRLFEIYRIVIKTEGMLQAQPHIAGTEEYITVFQGSLELTADSRRFTLAEGDSIRFRADVPHAYRNAGTTDVQLSMLIYYAKK